MINISTAAQKQIQVLQQGHTNPVVLCLSVVGGGCSGLSYDLRLVESSNFSEDQAVNNQTPHKQSTTAEQELSSTAGVNCSVEDNIPSASTSDTLAHHTTQVTAQNSTPQNDRAKDENANNPSKMVDNNHGSYIKVCGDGGRVMLLVESSAYELIKGSTLDFLNDNLGEESFVIKGNPQATSKCGCGTSFGV